MNIQKVTKPERYWVHFPEMKEGILFQCGMENPMSLKHDWMVIGRVKDSRSPKGKLKIMWSGTKKDFIDLFKGQGCTEKAPKMENCVARFIHECYFLK